MTIQQFKSLAAIPGIEKYYDILPVFATQEYADYLKETKNYSTIWFYSIINADIKFLIPFAVRNKYIFKIGMFLTASIRLDKKIDIEIEREFLNSVLEIIKQKKLCDWIEQSPNWALFNVVPSNTVYCEFGTYRIDLDILGEDELFNRIDSKARKEIRKGAKNNVVIKTGFENLDDCVKIFSDISKREKIRYPDKHKLEALFKYLPDNVILYVSYHDTIPQSCVIFIFNKLCNYGLFSGTISAPQCGSNYLLRWQSIKDAKIKGIKYFDFVGARVNTEPGSKLERIQRFKRQFAGEISKGFIWKMPISNTKYYFYSLLVRIISFIKFEKFRGDIIDQELKRLKK